MNIVSAFAISISAVINLVIGSYVFIKRPYRIANQAFAIFTLGTFLWGVGFVLLSYTGHMVFDSVTLLGVIFGVLGLNIFSDGIEKSGSKEISRKKIISLLPLLLLIVGVLNHWFISGVAIVDGQVHPINTVWFPIFALIIGFYVLHSLFKITKASVNKNYQVQSKGLVLLFSLGIFLLVSLIFNLFLPVFGIVWGNLLGFISLTILVLGCAYTLLFEHLFDVRFIFQKIIIYMSILILSILSFSALIFVVSSFFPWYEKTTFIVIGITTSFLVSMLVPVIDKKLRAFTDGWLFHGNYNYDTELLLVMKNLSSKILLDEIIEGIQVEIKRIFRSSNVHLVIADSRLSSLTSNVVTNSKNNSAWVPLFVESAFVGTLAIGEKRSGAAYTKRDLEFIETLTHYLASKLWLALSLRNLNRDHKILSVSAEKSHQENQLLREQQDAIISDLAHNLQTPLTILRSQLEKLSSTKLRKEELLHLEAHELEQHVEKISQFITQLLQAAKQPSHQYHFKTVELNTELGAIAEYLETIANASGIQFQYYENDKGIFANIDIGVFEEMITNVVSNAFKYRKADIEHKVSLTLEIYEGRFAKITITDNGLGIPKSDLPFLFERWYRANREQYSGTGLGLAMVKNIIEAHKGRIRIESELGEGTQVLLYIPLSVQ
jgi:signal transduction histidine kinase